MQATTWVKRESEQQYKVDLAKGRTLGGAKKGPAGWGSGFGALASSASGKKAPSAWMPKWMQPEPEPEPEPEIVEVSHEEYSRGLPG